MKKIIIFGILGFSLVSCVKLKKPNDLKNCVVIAKIDHSNGKYNYIHYMNLNDSIEYDCNVSKYWSNNWNIGDTIK